jgi:hypothetical protein
VLAGDIGTTTHVMNDHKRTVTLCICESDSGVTFALQRPPQIFVDVVDMKIMTSLPHQSTQTSATKGM